MKQTTTATTERKPVKVVVRKLEKLETTAIIEPCRNDLCS